MSEDRLPPALRAIADRFDTVHAEARTVLARTDRLWAERNAELAAATAGTRAELDALADRLERDGVLGKLEQGIVPPELGGTQSAPRRPQWTEDDDYFDGFSTQERF